MIRYNEYDISKMEIFEEIMEYLNIDKVTDKDVWDVAREYKDIPIFENILYELTLERIVYFLEEEFPDIEADYYVNCIDTHLIVNGKEITSIDDLQCILNEL